MNQSTAGQAIMIRICILIIERITWRIMRCTAGIRCFSSLISGTTKMHTIKRSVEVQYLGNAQDQTLHRSLISRPHVRPPIGRQLGIISSDRQCNILWNYIGNGVDGYDNTYAHGRRSEVFEWRLGVQFSVRGKNIQAGELNIIIFFYKHIYGLHTALQVPRDAFRCFYIRWPGVL